MTAHDDKEVTSVYCEHAGTIIPLDGDFCRACSGPAREGDGTHYRLTPRMLKQLGYAMTGVPDTSARAARRGRVLCVDNRASRNLALFLLKRAGYEVVAANSLTEALELIGGARFDLHLVNHKLLRGAGGESYEKLSEAAPATPVLFYSTVTYPFRRRSAHRGAGGAPVPVTEVARAVRRALGGAQERSAAAANQTSRLNALC